MTSPRTPDSRAALLRLLPSVDEIVTRLRGEGGNGSSDAALSRAAREAIGVKRRLLIKGEAAGSPDACGRALRETVLGDARRILASSRRPGLKRVINATGVALHTNLGRAPLSAAARAAIDDVARGYSNLEFDLALGSRGGRGVDAEALLRRLTGAEAALIVNNNAAAVMFAIHAMARDGEVIVSRGELVEIGGSFRIPDIMAQSGAKLVEVGTTNKTRISDYRGALTERTALLFKAHTSNYRIVGFTEDASREELAELGREKGVPTLEDLGSGSLLHVEGLPREPAVTESVRAGIDVVAFSGDKLLGGPQAGIVVGRAAWVEKMRKHPLMRALRVDKLTLAALEATLMAHLDPAAARREIPALRMLSAGRDELKERAGALMDAMGEETRSALGADVEETSGMVGGGAMPLAELAGFAVTLSPQNCSAQALEAKLRGGDPPVIARVREGKAALDLRCVGEDEIRQLAAVLRECAK